MRGNLFTLTGLVLIAAGAWGLYQAYAGANAGNAALAWGAILVGTLALLGGIGRRMSDVLKPASSESLKQSHTEIRALIQSIGVIAVADGKIMPAEISAIAAIHERMLGLRIEVHEIEEILSEFGPDFDITSRLTRDRGQISPAMKRMIVESCQHVMASDLEIAQPEISKIHEIGEALGFSTSDIDDIIAAVGT